MRRGALALLLVAVAIAGRAESALAASEKWWDAYNRGVAAVRTRNYEAAVPALQRALAEMPSENASARARNDTITYVPHFWLGIARFNLGDVDGALREWKTSEDQGAIQNTRFYAELRDWVARAQSHKQRTSESAAVEGKREANAAVGRAVSAQMDAVAAGGDRSDSYRAAQRKLQEALDIVSRAGTDMREYRRAADMAGQARDLFASAAEEAKKQKAARPAVAQKQAPPPAKREVVVPFEPAPKPVSPKVAVEEPKPQPQQTQPAVPQPQQLSTPAPQKLLPPPTVSEALAEALVALQQYRRHLSEAGIEYKRDLQFRDYVRQEVRQTERWQEDLSGKPDGETIRRISDQVVEKERELGLRIARIANAGGGAAVTVVPENVRPTLESAYRAFAMGDFDRSEQQLTRILVAKESGEAYLLRGCGRYTQAMLSRKPEPLLASATSDFRAAIKLNGELRLDPAAFSPKLVAFFDQLKGVR